MIAAQKFLKDLKDSKSYTFYESSNDRPWTEETDDLFFSKRKLGLASWLIPTGSPIYYEFEGLILKFSS